MDLSNNTILITGGSSGIGLAMAEAFLAAGNEVIICARGEERLLDVQRRNPKLHTHICDVAASNERVELFNWIKQNFKQLNVLVNNAGIQQDLDLTNVSEQIEQKIINEIAINLEAPILLSTLFIPFLTGKKNATIINVSSGLGFVPMVRTPVYCATKAGLHSFSVSLRVQVAKLGIKVYEVIPPGVATNLNAEGRAKIGVRAYGIDADEFVASVIKDLGNDAQEIGYGFTAEIMKASKSELDKRFQMMNG